MKKLESQPVFKKTATGGRKMARKYRRTSLCHLVSIASFLRKALNRDIQLKTLDEPY